MGQPRRRSAPPPPKGGGPARTPVVSKQPARTGYLTTPWAAACAGLAAAVSNDRWRLSALDRAPGWEQFVTAWRTVAGELAEFARGEDIPGDAALMPWGELAGVCWGVVDAALDAALEVVEARSGLASASVVDTFEILRGAGLVYPDGGVHAMVLDRANRDQARRDAEVAAEMKEYERILRSGATP